MKLHLPKTLLAAVLACFTVGDSYGLSISSRATWDVDTIVSAIPTGGSTTKSWNGTTYTFTSSGGMLDVSGYALSDNSLSNITFEANKTKLQALTDGTTVSLVLIEFGDPEPNGSWANNHHKWGVNVKGTAENASSLFTGQADNGNDWTGNNAGRTNVSGMAVTSTDAEGNERSIVSAYFDKSNAPGVSLANGYESKTTQADCIYYAHGLRWKDSNGDLSLKFNTTYVTSLIQQANRYESSADSYKVGNADGTWTYGNGEYTSMATAVSETRVDATLVAGGRLEITSSNAQLQSTNGGDIIIGGSGQLFLQGHGSNAAIELSNNIYLGDSEHGEADTYGALRFGSDGAYTITLSGNITLVEDSTMGSNTGENVRDVFINGNVSGNYKLSIVKGTGIDFAGGINLGSLELASGVSIDIKSQAATVGTFGTTGTGAQVTVTGTTLTINGTYAGYSNVLTTGADGAIVFGQNATIDVSKLTATGNSDRAVDGFIQESYRVTASGVNASISGDTIALVKGEVSLGNATWNSGEVTMGGTIYNVATTKSYADYLKEAAEANKTAISIEVQQGGTFKATDIAQTISIVGSDGSTLAANWTGRAVAGAAISTAATTFHGDVVVKSGASWLIGNGYSFSSITVESGGQFGLDGTYTGNMTISGTGVTDASLSDQQNGALKFGNGGTLVGDVTISGNKAALSTWGTAAGTIKGNINCTTEGGAELELLNGDKDTNHTGSNTITVGANQVGGNLSGINKVTTTAASMTVTGTIGNFGDTFTKSGAGTLTLSKAGAITGGKVIVEGGTLELTGIDQNNGLGTLPGVSVEVKKGATIKVGHDCAGWGTATSSISLTGAEGEVATMINNDETTNGNTLKTTLNLKGYAEVTDGNLMSFGGSLSAEKTGNVFSSQLLIAKDFTVTVEEGGELEISGQIVNSAHGEKVDTAKLIKEGAGELKLTHANNTFTRGGIALNAGTLTIANESATTTAAAITGTGTLATSGVGAKTFSAAVTAGNITISGGTADFDGAVTTGALTVGAATTMSSLTLSGAATLNASLTVEGDTSLSGGSASITLADGAIFSTGNETITKLTPGTGTTIRGTGTVSVATAGITYTNALIDVTAENNISTIAATLHDSKVVNKNNTGESSPGVNVSADSLADGTNDVAAENGNITITGVGENGVTVKNLTVESDKTVSATPATGIDSAGINVTGTASLANGSTVGGNVTIADSGELVIGGTGFSADRLGAIVEGTLTANATAISIAEASKIDVTDITETTTYVLATAQNMTITGNFNAADFYTGTLAQGMTATVSVQQMQAATYAIDPATASQLVLTLTAAAPDAPVTLTATATSTTYREDLNTLYINVEGYAPDELTQFAGRDLAVTVGREAWASIVDAMKGVEGGVYNNAIISLNYLPLDHFGTVSFNGYTGTGHTGEYFVAYIPEPATATLSLLALAALAARRRRK